MDIHKIIFHRFIPPRGPPHVWLEVRYLWFGEFKDPSQEQSIRAIFEQKGLCIFKNAMTKIRNGHDGATWILPNIFKIRARLPRQIEQLINEPQPIVATQLQRPPTAWEVVEKTKKLNLILNFLLKLKYKQRQQELQQSAMEEGTSINDSNSLSINDNDIYLEVFGRRNAKWNVYGLGKLTSKFMHSTRIPTNLIEMPMVQKMEEMRETIHKFK
ncbi:hypothetical protein CR513_33687, partial [Mucuna pruriens]